MRFNHRIVARRAVDPMEVTWVLEVTRARGWRGLSRSRVVRCPGRIRDVSVAGAQIEGPADPVLPVGATVTVRVRGEDSTVTVRRSSGWAQSDIRVYGVEFRVLGSALEEQISAALGRAASPGTPWLQTL